jgi:hypothetical protein
VGERGENMRERERERERERRQVVKEMAALQEEEE